MFVNMNCLERVACKSPNTSRSNVDSSDRVVVVQAYSLLSLQFYFIPDVFQFTIESSSAVYRVIHKSLRDFRTRLRNNQDRHGRKEHINR